jgi:hypothetical protein
VPSGWGFGGASVEVGPPARYQRYTPPRVDEDEFGGGEEPDTGEIDERGRGVLTQVSVQRTPGGSRVGVRVDGGARYNIGKRSGMMGRSELVLTLFDTRAANLDVRRVLDATVLDATVLRVLPTVEEGARFRIELVIEMKKPAPVRIAQESGMLWLAVGDE